MNRSGSPPQIQLVSLKNFSGLENVRSKQLSTQDSLRSTQLPSQDSLRSNTSLHLQPQDSVRSSTNTLSQDSLRSTSSQMSSQDSIRSSFSHSLAGQDSVDSVNHQHNIYRAVHIPSTNPSEKGGSTARLGTADHQVHTHHNIRGEVSCAGEQRQQNIAIIEENKVKIQVPGPANSSSSRTPASNQAGLTSQSSGRTQLSTSGQHKSDDN